MARHWIWVALLVAVAGLGACAPKRAETTPPARRVEPPPRPVLAEAGEPCANDRMCVKGLRCHQGMCVTPQAGARGSRGAGDLGVPSCDTFLAMYRCYLAKLPAAAAGPAGMAFQRIRAAWLKALASGRPGTRKSIALGCQRAVTAFRRALANNPRARSCLQP